MADKSWIKLCRFKPGEYDRSPYIKRDQIVKSLGFASFGEYLQSPLWAEVRNKAFERNGAFCVRCGGDATQIHHASYSRPNLTGRDVRRLKPVCSTCHERAERHKKTGSLFGLRAANQYLQGRRSKRGKQIMIPPAKKKELSLRWRGPRKTKRTQGELQPI